MAYNPKRDSHRAIADAAREEEDGWNWLVSEVYMARMEYENASNECLRLQEQIRELTRGLL